MKSKKNTVPRQKTFLKNELSGATTFRRRQARPLLFCGSFFTTNFTCAYETFDSCYLIPTFFYGVEVFGNCTSTDMQKLKTALNSIYDHKTSLANSILVLGFKQWIDLKQEKTL